MDVITNKATKVRRKKAKEVNFCVPCNDRLAYEVSEALFFPHSNVAISIAIQLLD